MGADGKHVVGTVRALYRYPVKSTAGQRLPTASVNPRGFAHDRLWAAYTADGGIASGKRSQRFRPVIGLMQWRSTATDDDDVPWLIDPAGNRFPVDDPAASKALSDAFGQPLTLRPETTIQHHDDCGVHIVTTSALAALHALVGGTVDERRFRANILLDTGTNPEFIEDDWTGEQLAIGPQLVLRLGPLMPRCVMIDQDQADVMAEPKALRDLGERHDTVLGLQAEVVRPGTVSVGDTATLFRTAS